MFEKGSLVTLTFHIYDPETIGLFHAPWATFVYSFAFQIQMAFELEQGKDLRKAVHIRLKGLVSEMCYWNCSIQKLLFINTLKYNSEKELLYNWKKGCKHK